MDIEWNHNPVQWGDVLIHVGVAIALLLVLHFVGVPDWLLLVLNTIGWPAREVWQHWPKFWEIITRPQPRAEWIAPVTTGFVLFGVSTWHSLI